MALFFPHSLLLSLLLLAGVTINSASTVSPEMYWKSVLPNTPMPSAIKSSLVGNYRGKKDPFKAAQTVCGNFYNEGATKKQVDDYVKAYGEAYLLETQIVPGRLVTVRLKTHTENKATFLPSDSVNSIPFSSRKLPEILHKLSIKPNTNEARAVEHTIKGCETHHEGEARLCTASLESMVSFVTSRLGSSVSPASSTTIDREGKIEYRITGVQKLVGYGSPVVVCHKENYPYTVFNCHQVDMTSAYMVSLVRADGANVRVAAACHMDTSWWNPKHASFQVLKSKPGMPVCHFLDDLAVVWTQK